MLLLKTNLHRDEWTTKNAVFSVTPCGSCKNRRFGGRIASIRVIRIGQLGTNNRSSPILVTLMMEALRSSGKLDLTRATRDGIPRDGILHSHRRGNIKSYTALTGWAL
jgi:hypothetical protein